MKKHFSSRNRRQIRTQKLDARCNQIGIHKMNDVSFVWKNSRANVVFPAPFGPAMTMQRGDFTIQVS
jgi:hypothetical protein